MNAVTKENWLSLNEASNRLGVHPTTLRRWSDSGKIPVFVTPGGHRRFSEHEIESFARERLQLQVATGLEELLQRHAIKRARMDIASHSSEPWLASLSEEDRMVSRDLGRRLLGLALQFIVSDDGHELLAETEDLGFKYGRHGQSIGIPLEHMLRASMFFRDSLIETSMDLPESAASQQTSMHLVLRINELMNVVQLAVVRAYGTAA
ncbi:MAG TPA: helix-turn-helix domain-containing protein [Rhodothermia bacterium]|nr:helix-turn-helix domain-containing protein [Rhodothermia bacterium]